MGIWDGEVNPLNGQPFSPEYHELRAGDAKLPMRQPHVQEELFALLDKEPVLVLAAGTGTGKTTGIGGLLLEYTYSRTGRFGNIVCTQPKQMSAEQLGDRVAKLLDVPVGQEVGFKHGDKNRTKNGTTILTFMTEGILRRMMVNDPMIKDVSMVIIDEAHERNMETDLNLFFLRQLVRSKQRPDFRVIIMSATIDPVRMRTYFGSAAVLKVPGKAYGTQRIFAPRPIKDTEYVKTAVQLIQRICADPASLPGDILIFLPTKKDLTEACQQLGKAKLKQSVVCLELHAKIPEDQKNAIAKMAASHWEVDRKVVMSTDVAEASVTVDGLVYVIDSGKAQQAGYDPTTGIKTLDKKWVAQANIEQRYGRVGRTKPGIAFLMYTKQQFDAFERYQPAKMLHEDITGDLLGLMKVEGIETVLEVKSGILDELLDPPAPQNVEAAAKRLAVLGAVDQDLRITAVGMAMSMFPISVEMARSLLFSTHLGCTRGAIIAAVMTGGSDGFSSFFFSDKAEKAFAKPGGDLVSMLQLYEDFEEAESWTDFCRDNGVKEYVMMKIRTTYKKIEHTLRSLPADVVPPPTAEGNMAIVFPHAREAWYTTSISAPDTPMNRLTRCLLYGHFMNVALTDDKGAALHLLGSKDAAATKLALKTRWVFFPSIMRNAGKYYISATTGIVNPMWLFEAGRHYIPRAAASRKDDAAEVERIEDLYYRTRGDEAASKREQALRRSMKKASRPRTKAKPSTPGDAYDVW